VQNPRVTEEKAPLCNFLREKKKTLANGGQVFPLLTLRKRSKSGDYSKAGKRFCGALNGILDPREVAWRLERKER